jgi:hypothetical protein
MACIPRTRSYGHERSATQERRHDDAGSARDPKVDRRSRDQPDRGGRALGVRVVQQQDDAGGPAFGHHEAREHCAGEHRTGQHGAFDDEAAERWWRLLLSTRS